MNEVIGGRRASARGPCSSVCNHQGDPPSVSFEHGGQCHHLLLHPGDKLTWLSYDYSRHLVSIWRLRRRRRGKGGLRRVQLHSDVDAQQQLKFRDPTSTPHRCPCSCPIGPLGGVLVIVFCLHDMDKWPKRTVRGASPGIEGASWFPMNKMR